MPCLLQRRRRQYMLQSLERIEHCNASYFRDAASGADRSHLPSAAERLVQADRGLQPRDVFAPKLTCGNNDAPAMRAT